MPIRTAIFGVAFILTALGGAAAAQPALPDWSGATVGLSFGGLRSEGRADLALEEGPIIRDDVRQGIFPLRRSDARLGAVAAVSLGFDRQMGDIVVGADLDLMLPTTRVDLAFTRRDDRPFDPMGGTPFGQTTSRTTYLTRFDALSTLRLRAGVIRQGTLFYATGGLAGGRVTNGFTLDVRDIDPMLGPDFAGGTYRRTWSEGGARFGWVVGAGLERPIGPRTRLRAEVLHFDLADRTIVAQEDTIAAFDGERIGYRFRNSGQVARVGIVFRF